MNSSAKLESSFVDRITGNGEIELNDLLANALLYANHYIKQGAIKWVSENDVNVNKFIAGLPSRETKSNYHVKAHDHEFMIAFNYYNNNVKITSSVKMTKQYFIKLILHDYYHHLISGLPNASPLYTFIGSKVAGGMRQTFNELVQPLYATPDLHYIEPFVGSASLFLHIPLQPTWEYTLIDSDKAKINVLRVIKYQYESLIEDVDELLKKVESNPDYEKELFDRYVKYYNNKITFDELTQFSFQDGEPESLPVDRKYNVRKTHWKSPFFAAEYLIYCYKKSKRLKSCQKIDYKKLRSACMEIPLLNLKLRLARANIICADAHGFFNSPCYSKGNELFVVDSPYIGTEDTCGDAEHEISHRKIINGLKRTSGRFIWFSRSTCRNSEVKEVEDDKEMKQKDNIIFSKISKCWLDSYVTHSKPLYCYEKDVGEKGVEFMVTNIKSGKTSPYNSSYVPIKGSREKRLKKLQRVRKKRL